MSFFIIQQTRFLLCYYFDCHQIDRSFFLNSALSAVNLWQKVSLNGIEWQQTEFCFIYIFFFFFFHPFEGLWSVSKDDLLINKAIDTSLSFLFFSTLYSTIHKFKIDYSQLVASNREWSIFYQWEMKLIPKTLIAFNTFWIDLRFISGLWL